MLVLAFLSQALFAGVHSYPSPAEKLDSSTHHWPRSSTVDTATSASVRQALLIAIIVICATIVFVALCCSILCIIRIRYRITAMRERFYNRNKQQGSGCDAGATNDYADHLPKKNGRDKWEIKLKHLVIDESEKLGSGAFASVFKGTMKGKSAALSNHANLKVSLHFKDNPCTEVAIKMLHQHHTSEANKLDFMNEINFMKKLGYHPHVLNMIGCVTNQYNPLLIVELCSKGDLLKLLRHQRNGVEEEADVLRLQDLISFGWQISDGMSYLSSRGFIHRDVAARNVLVTCNNTAKIGDFGLCRYTTEALYTTRGGKLPIKWMAPESLRHFEFSTKSDVWSFGVLLYEIFTLGDAPYPSIQLSDMIKHLEQGNRLEKPEICPAEIYDLMCECWSVPCSRPSFEVARDKISRLLDVASEAYGYIQFKQEYRRLESFLPLQRRTSVVKDDDENVGFFEIHHDDDDRPCNLAPDPCRKLRTASQQVHPIEELHVGALRQEDGSSVQDVEDGLTLVI
uniref:Protein kinase domain-containing protein n=1 Tax=Steinernema glaseri TaxID=37863 RepID=A0A1I7Z8M5_9BILA